MKILFATDGSDASEKAASLITQFRLSSDDEVIVLHAFSWAPVISEWEYIYDNLRSVKEEVAPRILESASRILKQTPVKITPLSVDDYPDRAISEKARDLQADPIVLGTRGMKGIASRVVGSVTRAVAIKASQSVLAVQLRHKEIPKKIKVLFATDGSPHSDVVKDVLLSLPFPDDTELTIVSVIPTAYLDIPERFSIEVNEQMKKIVADIKQREASEADAVLDSAAKTLQSKFSKVEKVLRSGDPPIEILSAADQYDADIIAVGSSGMRGIKGMIGSVARYVLNHAACSVLIGKSA